MMGAKKATKKETHKQDFHGIIPVFFENFVYVIFLPHKEWPLQNTWRNFCHPPSPRTIPQVLFMFFCVFSSLIWSLLTNFCAPFLGNSFCFPVRWPLETPPRTQAPEGCVASRKWRSLKVPGRGGLQEGRGWMGMEKKDWQKDAQKVIGRGVWARSREELNRGQSQDFGLWLRATMRLQRREVQSQREEPWLHHTKRRRQRLRPHKDTMPRRNSRP